MILSLACLFLVCLGLAPFVCLFSKRSSSIMTSTRISLVFVFHCGKQEDIARM
ncbi:hypothetical protein LZ31DRAFT_243093 [Colletotrichum somersetense]|nr:hypothetical protein LZ31DRAFT_243093 [Colletotrichum somersetense]